MNKHSITAKNYLAAFVMLLAKDGNNIIRDWSVEKYDDDSIASQFVKGLAPRVHLWHMSTGVVGEVLELYELENGVAGEDSTHREELADALFYGVGMAPIFGREEDWHLSMKFGSDSVGSPSLLLYVSAVMKLDDLIKKYNVYNDLSKLEDIKEAWNDFFYQWSCFANVYFDSLQDAIDVNVEKLSKRYEGITYTNDAAKARADKETPWPSGT